MNKILMIMAVLLAFMFAGCDTGNGGGFGGGIFPSEMKGDTGDKGDTGLSAYEIWLENGNEGTEEDFIASLVGQDGLSAYEIAVENGYTGTVEEWLVSLIGATGDKGDTGDTGDTGADGVCPDCDPEDPAPAPEPKIDPIPEGFARTVFTVDGNFAEYRKVHFIDQRIIFIEDVIPEDGVIQFDTNVTRMGEHAIGVTFTKLPPIRPFLEE